MSQDIMLSGGTIRLNPFIRVTELNLGKVLLKVKYARVAFTQSESIYYTNPSYIYGQIDGWANATTAYFRGQYRFKENTIITLDSDQRFYRSLYPVNNFIDRKQTVKDLNGAKIRTLNGQYSEMYMSYFTIMCKINKKKKIIHLFNYYANGYQFYAGGRDLYDLEAEPVLLNTRDFVDLQYTRDSRYFYGEAVSYLISSAKKVFIDTIAKKYSGYSINSHAIGYNFIF